MLNFMVSLAVSSKEAISGAAALAAGAEADAVVDEVVASF
jgi:hypothetical protein